MEDSEKVCIFATCYPITHTYNAQLHIELGPRKLGAYLQVLMLAFSAGIPLLVEGRPKPDVRMVIACAFLVNKRSNKEGIIILLNNS